MTDKKPNNKNKSILVVFSLSLFYKAKFIYLMVDYKMHVCLVVYRYLNIL